MITLLLSAAFAQEPQVFDPVPADVKIDGVAYSGILVDEATFAELGQLRVLKMEQEGKLEAFADWKTWADTHYSQEAIALRSECVLGQTKLTDHYEDLLKTERKRNFFQQQGFSLGIAVGLVGATGIYIGATHFYGNVLQGTIQN